MAINPETKYPGKIAPSSPEYPYGAARNITTPGDGTGTPWEAALVNDIFGFQQALLSGAGVVPSGNPDKVGASQYLDALGKVAGKHYPTTADMVAGGAPSKTIIATKGDSAEGDGGFGYYLSTAPGDFTGTPDEVLDLTMSDGNIAVLLDRVGVSKTLNVPSEYPSLSDAFDRLSGLRIDGAVVTIKMADGLYNESAGTLLNHPDGINIHIIGNQTTPANVELRYPNAFGNVDALLVSGGHRLGFLDGVKITKVAKADNTDIGTAVLAVDGSVIICGDNVETDNWYYGIAARNGSYIKCNSANVDNAGDVGIWAFVGSAIQCRNATSNNASDAASPLGFGIQAEYGSAIDCEGASATGCKIGGIAALSNSNVRALSTTTNGNVGSGLFARDGATIEAHNAVSDNNTRYGVEEVDSGRVYGAGLQLLGNTLGDFAPVAILANNAGSRIFSRKGALRLDTIDASSVFFHTGGGVQAEIFDTPNSVNWLAKTGAAAGNSPRIQATGSDTDVDVQLSPKGAGHVKFGQLQALGGEVVASYIEIKDSAGVVRKLAVVA